MSARIWYWAAGKAMSLAFAELGHDASGAWGIVDDAAWLATPGAGALELLYVSKAEYDHAMRRLPPTEVAIAIQHRRKTFATEATEEATGLLQNAIWAAIGATDDSEAGMRMRKRLLAVHARFIDYEILRHEEPAERLEQLIRDDGELFGNLASPSMKAAAGQDMDGKERALRRRFAEQLSAFRRPEAQDPDLLWPYFEAERVYAVTSATGARPRCSREDGPCPRWRDATLMALHERDAQSMRAAGDKLDLVYATKGELIAADYLLTAAQLDVEISERIAAPDLVNRLQIDRVAQATARLATRMLSKDRPKLAAVLAAQVEEETRGLGIWGRREGQVRGVAPAKEAVRDAASLANLMAGMLARGKSLRLAAQQKAMAKALASIAKGP
jgi:hypothetical protein